jgi:hypothetical protein
VPTSVLSSDQVVRIGDHWVAVNFVSLKIMATSAIKNTKIKQWPNGRKFAHLVTLPLAPTTLTQKLISVQKWFEKKILEILEFKLLVAYIHMYIRVYLQGNINIHRYLRDGFKQFYLCMLMLHSRNAILPMYAILNDCGKIVAWYSGLRLGREIESDQDLARVVVLKKKMLSK